MGQHSAAAACALVCAAALGVAAPAFGQTITDEGVWTTAALRGRVSEDAAWRWAADGFVQSRDGVQTLDLAFGHVMVTRDIGRRAVVGAGYGFGAGFRTAGILLEHRLTQVVAWNGGGRTRVSFRTLLEERFVTGRDGFLLRAREQVKVVWPLADRGRLRGLVSEEVLVQADSRDLGSPRVDGNRLF